MVLRRKKEMNSFIAKTEFFWFLLKNVYISNFGKVKNHLHVRIMQVPILRQLLLCNDLTIQPGWCTLVNIPVSNLSRNSLVQFCVAIPHSTVSTVQSDDGERNEAYAIQP